MFSEYRRQFDSECVVGVQIMVFRVGFVGEVQLIRLFYVIISKSGFSVVDFKDYSIVKIELKGLLFGFLCWILV